MISRMLHRAETVDSRATGGVPGTAPYCDGIRQGDSNVPDTKLILVGQRVMFQLLHRAETVDSRVTRDVPGTALYFDSTRQGDVCVYNNQYMLVHQQMVF